MTYHVYDYGRVGKDGKKRDIHIEKALAVTNRIPIARDNGSYPQVADCDYFTVDKLYPDSGIIPCLLKRRSNTGAEIRGECLISTLQLYIKNIIKRNFRIHDLQYPARFVNPRDHAG